ncbi:hypothetical protein VP01_1751g4 [Puccinia sorghi]|uniref:Uncharacterized protein n=1 Tax=Puccinia sorghi TaxID=27349 RepID=A0A0L6VF13_9BASI|nr:hypothetical protein VP01_1751g4 [Puccinia sorghi]
MSSNNTNNLQADQPETNGSITDVPAYFRTMLDEALNQQAEKYERTIRDMADELNRFKMAPSAPQNQPIQSPARPAESPSLKNTKKAPGKQLAGMQPIKKKPANQSVSISKPSAPPKKTAAPQTQRAKAVATNLQQKNFCRAQSEPLQSVRLITTPQKNSPQGSLKKGSPSTAKKKPNQLMLEDYPVDFLDTKECLFTHIRLLWGIVEVSTPPPPANPTLVEQFCNHFGDIDTFERHVKNSNAAELVSQADVQTMKDARAGRIRVGNHFVHIDETHIHYIHGYLAKLGIQCWGPNLEEGPESLFNSAMRIAALNTFRQMAIANGYDFMNFNRKYINDMARFIYTYNHYVHHVSSIKFVAETKQPGKYKETVDLKNASKNRTRLRDARYKFAVANDYPERYKKIIKDPAANSDDEWDPKKNCFSIRTLPYRSCSASFFFRQLDDVMKNVNAATGKTSRMRVRRLPEKAILSRYSKAPKGLPLDFYNRGWLGKLPISQQQMIPDTTQVAFLPDPKRSLLAKNHPRYDKNEKLSDRQFNRLYLAQRISQYHLDDVEEDEESEGEEDNNENNHQEYVEAGEVIEGGVIDLEAESDGYLEDGDWGNYYKSDEDPDYQEDSQGNDEDNSSEDDDEGQEDEEDVEMNQDDDEYVNYGGHHLDDAEEDAIHDEEEMF